MQSGSSGDLGRLAQVGMTGGQHGQQRSEPGPGGGRLLISALPEKEAWFPADIRDGGAHYGQLHTSGAVHATCGAVFEPLTNPYTGHIAWWHKPVDDTHGCLDCLRSEGKSS